jgi:hypothetical protein
MKKIIGIDPDLKKNGVALFDITTNTLTVCKSMYIWDLFTFLNENKTDALILLEFSMSNYIWHQSKFQSRNYENKIAANVGKNKAAAQIILDFLTINGYNFKQKAPAGYSLYFKNADFFKRITGYQRQTNNDARAAAALIFSNK